MGGSGNPGISKIEAEFKNILAHLSGTQMCSNHEQIHDKNLATHFNVLYFRNKMSEALGILSFPEEIIIEIMLYLGMRTKHKESVSSLKETK